MPFIRYRQKDFSRKWFQTKSLRFAEMLGGGPPLHGLICGGGTTETQKLAIRKNLNPEEKKRQVKKLAGIPEGR